MTVLCHFGAIWGALHGAASGQDRLELRDLTVIADQPVARFDLDGVALGDGRTVGWDRIQLGLLRSPAMQPRQAEFERLRQEVGEPLYRLRQRMKVGDFRGLGELAAPLQIRYQGRTSEPALLIAQSLFWSRLAEGRREEALLAHLEGCRQLRANPGLNGGLPADRATIDPASGLSAALPPVWFDGPAAAKVKDRAIQLAGAIERPRPAGVYAYCASLALAAGDSELAERMMQATGRGELGEQLRAVLESQRRVLSREAEAAAPLNAVASRCEESVRPVALYWLGRAQLADGNRELGQLALLRLVAAYGASQPELAAAALHEVAESLARSGAAGDAERVRAELRSAYANTHYGKPLQNQDEIP